MKKLFFEPPTEADFLKALQPLWGDDVFSVCLIGKNDLADALAAVASHQGVAVQRSDEAPASGSAKKRLLIFTEISGEELSKQLLSCVDQDNVVILAPITDWHFSRKPLFVVSIPKSGTHLVYELAGALGYHAGVEAPEFPLGQTWYCIEYSNSHTVARDFFVDTVRRSPFGNRHHSFMRSPTLFMYRHPLDILVSEAHYYHQDGKTAFAGWLDEADFDARVTRLFEDNWLLGSLRERIGGFLPWLDFPNVISLSFEELIGAAGGGSDVDQLKLIWSIQLKLQAPGDPREIASHLFNPNSATFRFGQLGGYKKFLSSSCVSDFTGQNKDILAKFGYPLDGSVQLPADREPRRKRNIRFSEVDYENLPLVIEHDFFGCNLVRYGKSIYAIPNAAGPVELSALSRDMLAAIPSGASLSEIKAMLLIGNTNLSIHRQSLKMLALALKGSAPVEKIYRYWMDFDKPAVVEEYNGFNLVSFKSRFFGIRQSQGVVDLSGNLTDLLQCAAPDDFMIARSLDELRDDIDGFSASKRVRQEAAAAHERVMALVGVLEARLMKFAEDALAERIANRHEIEVARQEAAVAHERTVAMISALEAQLRLHQSEIRTQQQRICDLQTNWSLRITNAVKRLFRGDR